MCTMKDNTNNIRGKQNLIDGRIDLYYKSTKSGNQIIPTKRLASNSPPRNCDFPKCNIKQKTLSPWIIKKNKTPYIRRRRKLSTPKRSANSWDPNFRGATLWFNTKLKGADIQLSISSYFSNTRNTSFRHQRKHRTDSFDESKSNSENEETREIQEMVNLPTTIDLDKKCASCDTIRTPLWRDAEDGTPLCNACGIRYRKYRTRCSSCWNIPRKDSKMYSICSLCGSYLITIYVRKL